MTAGIGTAILFLSVVFALLPTRRKSEMAADRRETGDGRTILEEVQENITEQTPENMNAITPLYDNSSVQSVSLGNGVILSVGSEDSEKRDSLVLYPQVETNHRYEHAYGIYLDCPFGELCLPNDPGITEEEPAAGQTYVLTGRTWDHRTGSGRNVCWRHGPCVPGDSFSNVRFTFRVADLSMRRMIGSAECGVSFREGTFSLTPLASRDACETGSMTREQKRALVKAAADFLTKEDGGYFRYCRDWFKGNGFDGLCLAEEVKKPYFRFLLNAEGKPVTAESFPYVSLIAVTLPTPAGPATVYFADSTKWNGCTPRGQEEADPETETGASMTVAGMDFLRPEREDSLIVPGAFHVREDRE